MQPTAHKSIAVSISQLAVEFQELNILLFHSNILQSFLVFYCQYLAPVVLRVFRVTMDTCALCTAACDFHNLDCRSKICHLNMPVFPKVYFLASNLYVQCFWSEDNKVPKQARLYRIRRVYTLNCRRTVSTRTATRSVTAPKQNIRKRCLEM